MSQSTSATNSIRVGIVGGNVDTGWAADAHIPALAALPGFRISAISTSRRESADHSARELALDHGFTSAQDMADCADVDLVSVVVKAPDHEAAATPALKAGKAVYCEWPLGGNTAQAERMTALARQAGVQTVVGLQSRASPEIIGVRRLLAEGYVGKIESVGVYGSYSFWSDTVSNRFMPDVTQGVNLLSIPGGHTLDAVNFMVDDDIATVQAQIASNRPTTTIRSTGEVVPFTSPDHVAVLARYRGGAILTMNLLGGSARPAVTRIDIQGQEGAIQMEIAGLVELSPMTVTGWRKGAAEPETLLPAHEDAAAPQAPAGRPFNVGQVYGRLAAERAGAPRTLPDFAHALALHRLLDAIVQAAQTGDTVRV